MPETVELAVTGGSWRRLMCPVCKRYIPSEVDGRTTCHRCGRIYRQVPGGWREVVADDES